MDPFEPVGNLLARQTEADMNLNMTSVVQSSLPATAPGTSQPVLQSEEEEEEEFPQLWEGDLTAKLNGQTVIITKLKAGLWTCLSFRLAEDWPSTMLIDTFVSQSFFDKIPYDEKTNVLVFVPTNPQHILFEKMQKTKDLAAVRLPSQLLALMAPVEKDNPMSGILFPKYVFRTNWCSDAPFSSEELGGAMAEDMSKYLQD
uniref:mediator of RNA polymerase II transcription subunit 25-like n=1 Tax=Erigeron canadensis TaxID=72917 RepID=UPI001CB89AD4|nr:mediator of RNA polymerase II transcription subunit 25-like [Erigeron canadensis]